MSITGYLTRDDRVVWRDIAGQVVIAERDNSKIRTLNKVASLIWTMADGTQQLDAASSIAGARIENVTTT